LESSNYLLFSLKGCFCFYLDVFTVLQITLPPDNYVHAPYNLENFSVPKTRVLIIWINFLLFGGALITWMHFIWKRRNPLETVMAIARSLFGMNLPWGA
jgi:hypothetical protein